MSVPPLAPDSTAALDVAPLRSHLPLLRPDTAANVSRLPSFLPFRCFAPHAPICRSRCSVLREDSARGDRPSTWALLWHPASCQSAAGWPHMPGSTAFGLRRAARASGSTRRVRPRPRLRHRADGSPLRGVPTLSASEHCLDSRRAARATGKISRVFPFDHPYVLKTHWQSQYSFSTSSVMCTRFAHAHVASLPRG
ncbi:hypothetical protein AURDEDRAFT_117502 [Auricularia subglabra TFB-10046 SS5]|nr:hypothetical protein AURDEDRAFT_117502 [Auricularia subglabra TFB-10046 SS5]